MWLAVERRARVTRCFAYGWIAAAGWFMGTLLGAATGAVVGGLVGALTHVGVPHEEAVVYENAVRGGRVLLVVQATEAMAQRIAGIMNADGAVNVQKQTV